ncbi:copper chaperone PCu(A)C [Pseudooceanicola sp.]|uniref:copper chaperone PCu(A)C n=1 Tax=Pseudooceanicola sp. TaxID=1914328 RepID=UPI002624B5DA|nr:copper chaperone PCu(A)C [Pseudooceanicola sp.]MDF1856099.1 copper chaperone PCu(A)C [Pseudooceanicola sp.]
MPIRHLKRTALAVALVLTPLSALAGDIQVEGAYARASSAMAKSGAAFMTLHNSGSADDRLIDARSDIAQRVELHTHIDAGNGVMQMRQDEDGFPLPAGGDAKLARGGDHVMFMGLNRPMNQGDMITVTLVFEKSGEMTVEIPVDLNRKPDAAMGMGHGKMGNGNMQHGKMSD